MSIEDVVLVSTVREDIRGRTLQVDIAEIPLRVEAQQLEIPFHLRFPRMEAPPPVDLERATPDHESDGELSVSPSYNPFRGARGTWN